MHLHKSVVKKRAITMDAHYHERMNCNSKMKIRIYPATAECERRIRNYCINNVNAFFRMPVKTRHDIMKSKIIRKHTERTTMTPSSNFEMNMERKRWQNDNEIYCIYRRDKQDKQGTYV